LKINKKILKYAGAAVYLFVIVMMGFVLFRQLDERDTLTSELAATRTNLEALHPASMESEKKEYEVRLVQVTSEADGLKDMMSLDIDNVPATELVFNVAAANGVQVVQLSAPTAGQETLEGVPCSVTVINATVQGAKANLVDFISDLNLALDTGVIQSAFMDLHETDNLTPQARILMEVYNYQG
jgi:hypothetical protein